MWYPCPSACGGAISDWEGGRVLTACKRCGHRKEITKCRKCGLRYCGACIVDVDIARIKKTVEDESKSGSF